MPAYGSMIAVATWTATNATASRARLRCRGAPRTGASAASAARPVCSAPSTRRGQQQQRDLPARPAGEPQRLVTQPPRGPARDGRDGPVFGDEPGGQPALGQPARRRPAHDDGRRAGDVRVDAGGGRDAGRAPARGGHVARARVDDVVHGPAAPAPAPSEAVPEVARPPAVRVTVSRGRRVPRVVVADTPTCQPPGRRPALATSPPRLTSTPQPARSAARAAMRSAASALAVAPRSSQTPRGARNVRSLGVPLQPSPAGRRTGGATAGVVADDWAKSRS